MVDGGQEGRLPQLLLPWLQEGKAARPARPGARGLPQLLRQQTPDQDPALPFQSGSPAPCALLFWGQPMRLRLHMRDGRCRL